MEESKKGNRNRFENLAPEIISDILSRLPIEWILSCKCVCKTWHDLIKDSYFVKLQRSVANDRPSSRVILEPNVYDVRHEVDKLQLLDIKDRKAREIPGFPLVDAKEYGEHMRIMSSLDGLICLASKMRPDPVLICNPLIRGDYIVLPKTGLCNGLIGSHHVTLGFDASINKYKAVRMRTVPSNSRHFFCEVITIGGEETSWRRVVAPYAGLFYQLGHGGIFHQGSIYWIIDKYNTYTGEIIDGSYNSREYIINSSPNTREYILEFNVTKEVFRVISFPQSVRAPKYELCHMIFSLQLQILGGKSLALMENDGQLLHIWRIVKRNGNPVVGYCSIRIESPYKDARVIALLRPNGIEDLLLLQTPPGRRWKDKRRKRKETQFHYYYPFSSSSKKSDRFVQLSSLQIRSYEDFIAWCFKPSLVSAKAALLRKL